jgi:hypothetical protein
MLNTVVLNLLEAQVTLYAAQADGTPGGAIWSGQVAERLTVHERWLTVQTRPTGAAYPVNHPLVPTYEIAIDRVWALPLSNLIGFKPGAGNYVLQVVWMDEDSGNWHRRTFYGATISARSFAPQSIESEFVDGQEFVAQYFVVDSGNAWTSPGEVTAPTGVVYWYGPDAPSGVALYNYAPSGGASFTLVPGATTAGRATIAADAPSDGALSITFDGATAPVLVTTASGVTVGELHDSYPTGLPQLVFCSGGQMVAIVSTTGFWCRVLSDAPSGGALTSGAAFVFQYQGQAMAIIGAQGAQALAWNVQN